jgi:DNA-binding transcriptional ArsR family regulator
VSNLDDNDRTILDALRRHFGSGGEPVHPEEVATIAGLSEDAVRRSLSDLYRAHLVEGATVEETDEPVLITGVR